MPLCDFRHPPLLPYIETAGELKTKPTQHAVKTFLGAGIQADILLYRSQIMPGAEYSAAGTEKREREHSRD